MTAFVYLNLRTKRWQVGDKPKSSAAFPQHDTVALRNVTFRVSAAQRDWCLAHRHPTTGRPYKFVHAFACGTVCDVASIAPLPPGGVPISYNVVRGPYFYRRDTGVAISSAAYVVFTPRGAVAYGVR